MTQKTHQQNMQQEVEEIQQFAPMFYRPQILKDCKATQLYKNKLEKIERERQSENEAMQKTKSIQESINTMATFTDKEIAGIRMLPLLKKNKSIYKCSQKELYSSIRSRSSSRGTSMNNLMRNKISGQVSPTATYKSQNFNDSQFLSFSQSTKLPTVQMDIRMSYVSPK